MRDLKVVERELEIIDELTYQYTLLLPRSVNAPKTNKLIKDVLEILDDMNWSLVQEGEMIITANLQKERQRKAAVRNAIEEFAEDLLNYTSTL